MKTLFKKNTDAVTLIAVFLLGTIGTFAQTYQDDVYYSPSKDTSKKVEKPKDVNKEVKKTYRSNDKVEDFSAAQESYAKMLSEKHNNTTPTTERTYNEKKSWVANTQGLTQKQDIQKEISLYNRGNVDADNPNNDYDEEYVLWQPTKVTRVYVQQPLYSDFYFGFNYGWGGIYYQPYYYRPYYTHYYDPFYWDSYYYWRTPYYYGYYTPNYWGWHGSYWRHHYYGPAYYGYNDYYYDRYYRNGYYNDRYTYKQRSNEFSDIRNRRRNTASVRQQQDARSSARGERVSAENANRRYSTYRRTATSNNRISTNNPNIRRGTSSENAVNRSYSSGNTYRRSSNIVHQGKAPYTRNIERTSNTYRRSEINSPRIDRSSQSTNYRQRSTQEYRRMDTGIRRSNSTTYRRSEASPIRRNNSTYRRTATTPSRSSSSYRTSPSRSTETRSVRSSSPSPRRTATSPRQRR